ncbi:MAG: hypothetical protein ACPGO3_00230 [Magnetospiraceae bacterium]
MNFESAAAKAEALCGELLEEILGLGKNKVSGLCAHLGQQGFQKVCTDNHDLLLEYIRLTPAKRKQRHLNLSPEQRGIFVLAALYYARAGLALLASALDIQNAIGGSARDTTSTAARLSLDLMIGYPSFWPFDDDLDPFQEF